MGILNDTYITYYAAQGMITPFLGDKVRRIGPTPVISYGLGSFGYDIRIKNTVKIVNPLYPKAIDPKAPDPEAWNTTIMPIGSPFWLPANSFMLAESIEYFRMPPDVLGLVLGKSTYARSGIVANFTPLEPDWEGTITIELCNCTPLPVLIYPEEGIAQAIFIQGEQPLRGYKSAGGSGAYDNQKGITHSRVSEKLP